MRELGATLVSIAPELPEFGLKMAERVEFAFPILSDMGNAVARRFGLVFAMPDDLRQLYLKFGIDLPGFNGDETGELPLPGLFIIGTDGKVVYAFAREDYRYRAEPSELIRVLEGLARESAPSTEETSGGD